MVDDDRHTPVIVIGAGIVGASIAFHLAERGARVKILDSGEPGQGASSASFAWINARGKNPRHYHDLNRRSLDMWDRFARRLGGRVGLEWGGEVRWAATPDGARALKSRVAVLQSWGYPIHLLGAAEVQRIEPQLAPGALTAASFSPADGHVDTHKVITGCLAGASQRGSLVISNTKVTGLDLAQTTDGPPAIKAVRAGADVFPCEAVVLAGGADSGEVANHAGIDLPVRHTFGATLITEPVPPIFRQAAVVHSSADRAPQVALRQFADGSVMIHGGEGGTSGRSLGQTDAEIRQVMKAAIEYVPALLGVDIREVRTGRRPIPGDGHPILGAPAAVANLYLAVTHSGVTLAPLIGELAAIEILDGAQVDLLEPYRLERFLQPDNR